MKLEELTYEQAPENAADLHLAIQADAIAWLSNRVLVLVDGSMIAIPNGWELYPYGEFLHVVFEPATPEFANA